ncbi:lectin, partial [Trifolium medium]|nr:lectin [Trifolium medium]
ITLEEDAKISASGVLELNDPKDTNVFVGRAFYTLPVPIWDPSTGNVASFITTFSFVLENVGTKVPADGLVFLHQQMLPFPAPQSVDGWE